MSGPPCKCTNCGHVFQSGLIEIGPNVSGISFENCGVSCPQCGGMANVADGTYSSVGEHLKLIAGPLSTRQIINQLNPIAKKAQAQSLTTEEVLAEIADISPDLAKKLKSIGPWPVVGILIFLFWLVKSVTLSLDINVNWLIDEAWHVAHGEDPYAHVGTTPPQSPIHEAPQRSNPTPFEQTIVQSASPNRNARRRAASRTRKKGGRENK